MKPYQAGRALCSPKSRCEHMINNTVERAYRKGDLFEKGRRLMDAWADFCAKPEAAGKVLPIRAR